MKRTHAYRPVPLGLSMLIALFAALTALAVSGGHQAAAHGRAAHEASISTSELRLRNDMRNLWSEHVVWTRLAVISLTTGSPDTSATVARLLRNQADIGNAIKPYYGTAAGNKLTSLLRQHILIAADLIAAAKAGDNAAVVSQQARWERNAGQLASFLSQANPRSWKLGAMKAMLHEHLRLTTAEVVARLGQKWQADIRAYDRIEAQAMHMADMLSGGIIAMFPGRFE